MKTPEGHRRPIAAALILLVVAAFAATSAVESTAARNEYELWIADQAELVIEVAGEAMSGVTADLEAVAALIEQSPPNSTQFAQFVERIDGTANAVGIGYLTELDSADIDEFIAMQREVNSAGYELHGFDDAAEPIPVNRSERTTFYPVHHFALGSAIGAALAGDPELGTVGVGLDAGFDPQWRAEIGRALDIDGPTFSEFTTLQVGYLTLERTFFASVPVAATADNSRGLVIAWMMEDLLLPELDRNILSDVKWEAIPPGSERTFLDNSNVRVYPMQLPGTTWSLAVAPTEDALAELQGRPWWIAGLVAATLAALAATAIWLFMDRRTELQRARRFQQVAEDKDRFLASVSHELRTPLTVVTGLAHELSDRPDGFSREERDGLMEMLVDESDELSGIVEDLLVAARSDIARVAIHNVDMTLDDVVAQAMEMSGVEATWRGAPGHAHADPQRVRQVLRNLLTNAKRYGGNEVRIDFAEGAGWTEISVADNGDGVPVEKREAIFQSYESAHGPTTDVRSVGLGLYISRNLARAMGGDLEYAYDGSWSHFRLRLRSATGTQTAGSAVEPGRQRIAQGSRVG